MGKTAVLEAWLDETGRDFFFQSKKLTWAVLTIYVKFRGPKVKVTTGPNMGKNAVLEPQLYSKFDSFLSRKSRSTLWHAIKVLVIMHLGYKYQVCTWLLVYGHFSIPLVILKKWTLTHKIQKWWRSDLIFFMSFNTSARCLQAWYGTPRSSGFNLCHPC